MNRAKHLPAAMIAATLLSGAFTASAQQQYSSGVRGSPTVPDPISVYDNWSAYDELSDHVPLTETLSMRELENCGLFGVDMRTYWAVRDGVGAVSGAEARSMLATNPASGFHEGRP
jgi:hypothetical protein